MKEILLKRHDSINKTGAEEEKSLDHPAPVPFHMFYKYSTVPTTVFLEDRNIKHTETLLNPSLAYIALHLPELAVVDAYRAGIAIDASTHVHGEGLLQPPLHSTGQRHHIITKST